MTYRTQRTGRAAHRVVGSALAFVVLTTIAWAQGGGALAVPNPIPLYSRLPPIDEPPAGKTPLDAIPLDNPPSTAADVAAETDAAAIEVQPLSSWYQPHYWLGPKWTGSIELGMNGSEGNAQTFSMRAGANLKRETELYTLAVEASHARTTADSLETQNNALGKLKLDRKFGESPWTMFGVGTAEYDQFKAFDLRLALHAGVGYKIIKTDATSLVGRLGSGVSHEIGGPDDSYVPEALLGLDFEHQITAKQKLVFKAEYLPEWGDFQNYRLVSDASWECLLDEESNLSLKIGAIDRYDSTPNGRKANDIDYLLLLMWKL
ncbi:MAG: DUF481 domain-containing protein [Pirellulales bacterium]